MPANTKNKRTAPRARARTRERAKGYESARPRGKSAKANDAVIANSIYSVRFKEKPGTEVFCKHEHVKAVEFEQMYQDLWKAWATLHYITTGEKKTYDARSAGPSAATVLHYFLADFKQLLPPDFKFNIEKDESSGSYFFMIYRECEWDRCWHCLAIGQVVKKLYKENRRLLDLFLSFLRALNAVGIDFWYQGAMGWALDGMDDRVVENADEWDPEDIEDYQDCIIDYVDGEPAVYKSQIQSARKMKPAELQKRAKRFKAGHPIANLIYQGAAILADGHSLRDFYYMPCGADEAGMTYLELDCQANIIWEESDPLFNDHSGYIDALANEGVQDPVLSVRIDASTRKIDFAELNKKAHWPYQLSQWLGRAIDLTKEYTDERKNRAAIKKV